MPGPASDKAYASAQLLASLGLWPDASGFNRYTPADGGTYVSGENHLIGTGMPISIPGAVGTYTSITGLSCPVGNGNTYRFNGLIVGTQGGASTNQQNLRFTGPSTSAGRWNTLAFVTGGAVQISSSVALSTANVTAAYAAGSTFFVIISGWFTMSAAGTLQFQAGQGGTGGAWSVIDGVLDVMPV